MILSASRRTDIPGYYSDWFYNRIKEGFLFVRNPVNMHQVSKIDLSPEVVDCIVFWTKNPAPMLAGLEELKAYPYYFQFTLTGYGTDIERNVPHKKDVVIQVFQDLSKRIGAQRVVWRYDPILFNDKYTPGYHLRAFAQIAGALRGYTNKCVISFVDRYVKNQKRMDALKVYELEETQLSVFAGRLSEIAGENGMEIGSCAENMDLEQCGIKHNSCIDKGLIESLTGSRIKAGKDKNQREACGCLESIDVGTYHTCQSGCAYCYANYSQEEAMVRYGKYDPASPLLCGDIRKEDRVTVRPVKSVKEVQLSFCDIR